VPLSSAHLVSFLSRLYLGQAFVDPEYSGRVTVPVLFDTRTKRIVNNESSEIIQMLNSEFNSFCATPAQAALNLYPDNLKADIDSVNDWIYPQINNGVYKCGFATTQAPYDAAFDQLFQGLDRVESILAKQRYLNSIEQVTLADVRLFTTLIRFDAVYHGHFKVSCDCEMSVPSGVKNS
jgi:putative glutathione S-transferase